MKLPLRYLTLAGWLLGAIASPARPVDLSAPSSQLGAADLQGKLEIWRTVEEAGIQLGQDSYLPFRYKFSSSPGVDGLLGRGFYLPMFEAKNYLLRQQMMRAYLPCGKGLYLRKDPVNPNQFNTLDGEWHGVLDGEIFTMSRDDGWQMVYRKGRLVSIVSEDKHVFTWTFVNGMPSGISKDGQPIVTVELGGNNKAAAFAFDGKRYEVEYGQRPMTQALAGQVVIKELTDALGTLKYPDGKSDRFDFGLTSKRAPTLEFSDRDAGTTSYTWDATSGNLITEKGANGDWTYKIGKITKEFGTPSLTRTDAKGKSEGIEVDAQKGIYTARGPDGSTTVTKVFVSTGPLNNKVKSVDRIVKNVTTPVYRASYDEAGRILRETDAKGFITSYQYDGKGMQLAKVRTAPSDAKTLAAFAQKETILLSQIATAKSAIEREDLIQQLGFLYIYEIGDISKALNLLPQITERDKIYNLKMHAISGNLALTDDERARQYSELLLEYPERIVKNK